MRCTPCPPENKRPPWLRHLPGRVFRSCQADVFLLTVPVRERWEGAEGGEWEQLCTLIRGLFSLCAGAVMRAVHPSDTAHGQEGL